MGAVSPFFLSYSEVIRKQNCFHISSSCSIAINFNFTGVTINVS